MKYEKSIPIYKSTVAYTRLDKKSNWIGFINDEPEKIFFHEFYNKEIDFTTLSGKLVEYKLRKGRDGKLSAFDTKVVAE